MKFSWERNNRLYFSAFVIAHCSKRVPMLETFLTFWVPIYLSNFIDFHSYWVPAGVNICPTKSETIYLPIWDILKLPPVNNSETVSVYPGFDTVWHENPKQTALIHPWVPKLAGWSLQWWTYILPTWLFEHLC